MDSERIKTLVFVDEHDHGDDAKKQFSDDDDEYESDEDSDTVQEAVETTHHRNKNQHRVARWYKSFGQLRRQNAKLMLELHAFTTALKMMGGLTTTISSSGLTITPDLVKSNKYLAAAQLKIEQRIEFLQRFLLPKCHLAFGNLIADNQYAVLGLMLMGLLASLNDILPMLPRLNTEEKSPDIIDTEPNNIKENVVKDSQLHDLGEIISRKEFKARHKESENQEKTDKISITDMAFSKQKKRNLVEEPRAGETKSHPHSKTRKKKTKKGDIFDDIFKKLL
ncbi:hypothetical protein EPUL_000488 [Erysiphe pulchra]|uniref:RNase MRP protein 1 RNA binding domain-containing protein n=1 Tax=Erysiphe pulchra TaxID=225359 RepID=A0A2S4PYG7_9PEZI|nr:hypothetical protein EPUL_000488 [Erysiphe pulchra]